MSPRLGDPRERAMQRDEPLVDDRGDNANLLESLVHHHVTTSITVISDTLACALDDDHEPTRDETHSMEDRARGARWWLPRVDQFVCRNLGLDRAWNLVKHFLVVHVG